MSETLSSTTNQTLYVHNINEKVKKDVLKKMLYMLFSQYGRVIQVVACKGIKMRGQAWVIFQDINSAATAMKGKQGFNFYGKPLKLEFAKEKSHVVARQEGLPVTKNGPHSKPSDKRKRVEKRGRDEEQDDDEDRQPSKDARLVINMTPHRILFAQNLPSEITQQSLTTVFQHIPGFREVRIVPGNRGMAFIEFETEVQSGMALRQLNGFQLTATQVLNLTYSS